MEERLQSPQMFRATTLPMEPALAEAVAAGLQ
jgi:hypothetical protein